MTAVGTNSTTEEAFDPYDSPRAEHSGGLNLRGMWALYTLTLRQHLHGKRWMVMAALFLLPSALAILVRSMRHDAPPAIEMETVFVFLLIPQAVLPLVALIYASGIISDEQEEQTITYLLIRPIPKWAIYIIKLKATLTTTILLTVLFTLLTYAAIYLGAGSDVENISLQRVEGRRDSRFIRRRLLLSVRAIESNNQTRTAGGNSLHDRGGRRHGQFAVRDPLSDRDFLLPSDRLPEFGFLVAGQLRTNLAADASALDIRSDPKLLEYPTTSTCLLVLLVASAACAIIAAILCSQREFHVKTPEKN